MIQVGITGQNGFIGTHLSNYLGLKRGFSVIPFKKSFFEDDQELDQFVEHCDVIVHLAALNRHPDPEILYESNVKLVRKITDSCERTSSVPHIIFSSSIQEGKENAYGKSKREGRELFQKWALKNNARFTSLLIPNVFGPFGKPFYNSVVATFCYQLTHGAIPQVEVNGKLNMIYVGDLISELAGYIQIPRSGINNYPIPCTATVQVSELLALLGRYKELYFDEGKIPLLNNAFELNLFNTFRSYIPIKDYFPASYFVHTDNRGAFVELIKLETGGQVSFSTTHPQIIRGNHFHTRKIERFSVISGRAQIQLRRIGTSEVYDFFLDGESPSYVDMPIWYTHNIKNIGDSDLLTVFWINEFYNPDDPDTYFETV